VQEIETRAFKRNFSQNASTLEETVECGQNEGNINVEKLTPTRKTKKMHGSHSTG